VVRAKDGITRDQKAYTATATDGKVTIFAENDSPLAHNMYVEDESKKVMGTFVDLPKKGSNGTVVLDLAPGTYRIVCKVPGHSNMNSSLTVS
jgi:plastocyanin